MRLPTVKAPPGYLLTPPAKPKREGRTRAEMQPVLEKYHADYRAYLAHNAAIQRRRAVSNGVESYQWVVATPGIPCTVASRNDGRVFRYDTPPPEGHVGEGQCDAPDWCRCIARSVIPGFE